MSDQISVQRVLLPIGNSPAGRVLHEADRSPGSTRRPRAGGGSVQPLRGANRGDVRGRAGPSGGPHSVVSGAFLGGPVPAGRRHRRAGSPARLGNQQPVSPPRRLPDHGGSFGVLSTRLRGPRGRIPSLRVALRVGPKRGHRTGRRGNHPSESTLGASPPSLWVPPRWNLSPSGTQARSVLGRRLVRATVVRGDRRSGQYGTPSPGPGCLTRTGDLRISTGAAGAPAVSPTVPRSTTELSRDALRSGGRPINTPTARRSTVTACASSSIVGTVAGTRPASTSIGPASSSPGVSRRPSAPSTG